MSEARHQLYCYSLAPTPYDWRSMTLLPHLPFKSGDMDRIDMFLLDKILKQIPGYASKPGAEHMPPGIVRFLVRNLLVVPHEYGLTRSPEGEYLANYLQENPPVPGGLNFPRDFGLDKLPSRDKSFGLIYLSPQEE